MQSMQSQHLNAAEIEKREDTPEVLSPTTSDTCQREQQQNKKAQFQQEFVDQSSQMGCEMTWLEHRAPPVKGNDLKISLSPSLASKLRHSLSTRGTVSGTDSDVINELCGFPLLPHTNFNPLLYSLQNERSH